MKTIWITGGKGFIGRNLAKYLATQQCVVYGIGHGFWSEADSRKWLYQSWSNAEIEFSNLDQLAKLSGKPDVIFHLAGGSSVGPSIQKPYEDYNRTVNTTARLLEWLRQSSINTKVIGVSSAAVYGAGRLGQINEETQVRPFSPYGFHKHMLETLFQSYEDNYGLDLGVVRLFSVYGAGLEKQLLWDVCHKIKNSNNGAISLHGSGEELRDWLHVSDAVNLLWTVGCLSRTKNLIVNGGTGVATPINEIAKCLIRHWHTDINLSFTNQRREGDPESLVADTTLAQSLGFTAQIDLEHGVADFVKWYKARIA